MASLTAQGTIQSVLKDRQQAAKKEQATPNAAPDRQPSNTPGRLAAVVAASSRPSACAR